MRYVFRRGILLWHARCAEHHNQSCIALEKLRPSRKCVGDLVVYQDSESALASVYTDTLHIDLAVGDFLQNTADDCWITCRFFHQHRSSRVS